MGDRALVLFTDGEYTSPTVYLHWHATEVPSLLEAHKKLMAGRKGDVQYAAARFIGICHAEIEGNLSLGVWNTPPAFGQAATASVKNKRRKQPALDEYSPGDGGVVVVDVNSFDWRAFGGYLAKREAPAPAV